MAIRCCWPPESRSPGLADLRLVAQRQAMDELVRVGSPRGPEDPLGVGLALAEGDVLGDRGVEEIALLEHEADLAPQRPVVERVQLELVVDDRAVGRLHQPREQLDQRRLAGAAAADDRDRLAGLDLEVEPLQDRRRLRAAVAEADVPQLDGAGERRHGAEPRVVGALLGLVLEHVVEAAEEDLRELELVPEHEQEQERRVRERDQRVERDELAQGEVVVDDLVRADEEEQRE